MVEALGLRDHVDVLAPQLLVRLALGVALVDAVLLPALTEGLGVVEDVLGPLEGESLVEDPAGAEHAAGGVVEHRQRSDRSEAGWLRRRDEELGDRRVGEPHHADLAAGDPLLGGDGLDGVVAVEQLQRFEVVVGAPRAPGPAHVDADHGVAERVCDQRARLVGCGAGEGSQLADLLQGEVAAEARRQLLPAVPDQVGRRLGGRIARVLDHGRVGAVLGRSGEEHRRGQRRAITGLDVVEPLLELLFLVEGGFGGGVLDRHDIEGLRRDLVRPVPALSGGRPDPVAVAGRDLTEDVGPGRVGSTDRDGRIGCVEQRDLGVGLGAGEADLLDARLHLERGLLDDPRQLGDLARLHRRAIRRALAVRAVVTARGSDERERHQGRRDEERTGSRRSATVHGWPPGGAPHSCGVNTSQRGG